MEQQDRAQWPKSQYTIPVGIDKLISTLSDNCDRLPAHYIVTALENYLHIYNTLENAEDKQIWIDEKAGVTAEQLEDWRQRKRK